jgi:hypothetical protein
MAVIQIFKNLCDSTYKTYLNQIQSGDQDLQTLLALKQFKQCVSYYQREKEIAADMLDEYWAYIFSGHIIDTLVGNVRKEEDLMDYRGRGSNGK